MKRSREESEGQEEAVIDVHMDRQERKQEQHDDDDAKQHLTEEEERMHKERESNDDGKRVFPPLHHQHHHQQHPGGEATYENGGRDYSHHHHDHRSYHSRPHHRSSFSPSPPSSRPRYCLFYSQGRCAKGDHCRFTHQDCEQGVDCLDFQCRLGHPRAWAEAKEYKQPCRKFRSGRCPRGDECPYLHQLCKEGGSCQDRECRYGHPFDWRCYGCERCWQGVTGAGVMLLAPSHVPLSYDLVLVEERSRDPEAAQEWGEMGGRIGSDSYGDCVEVARRELFEETAGTVDVPHERIAVAPFIETGIFHRYLCYIIVEERVSCRLYQEARKKPGLPSCFRETTNIHRFPLAPVIEYMKEHGGEMADKICSYKGKPYFLADRCRHVLEAALKAGLFQAFDPNRLTQDSRASVEQQQAKESVDPQMAGEIGGAD